MESSSRAKHLEMIQAVVLRLANTSFLIKGWGLTVLAGLFAIAAAKDSAREVLWVALIPMLAFAALDVYYLWLERIFRAHYRRVRAQPDKFDFDMDIHDLKRRPVESYWEVVRRPAAAGFWIPLLVSVPIAWLLLKR
jgi:hypothetical protein